MDDDFFALLWENFSVSSRLLTVLPNQAILRVSVNRCLNALLVLVGCKGAQVEEIWSMEPENFDNLKYVHTRS